MTELTERLAILTAQFMTTDCKQSHKRTRLFLEMQDCVRRIKLIKLKPIKMKTHNLNPNHRTDEFPLIMSYSSTIKDQLIIVAPETILEGDELEYGPNIYQVEKMNKFKQAKGVYPDGRPNYYDMNIKRIATVRYIVDGEIKKRKVTIL